MRDFSRHALELHAKPSSNPSQMDHCLKMLRKPAVDAQRYQRVWQDHVLTLADVYEMTT